MIVVHEFDVGEEKIREWKQLATMNREMIANIWEQQAKLKRGDSRGSSPKGGISAAELAAVASLRRPRHSTDSIPITIFFLLVFIVVYNYLTDPPFEHPDNLYY